MTHDVASKNQLHFIYDSVPIAVAARSKLWVYGRSLTRIVGSNPT
jgi:hypothetical protein